MARFEIYINSARGMEKTGSVAESLEEANKMIKSWGGNPNEYANYVIKTPEGKHIDYRDSADVADGKIVGGEGRSMDGIPWGLYQEGGRSYRGFEITSSEGGLRKGVYRFYNWGSGVPFGNAAVDGQFSEEQFQKLIGEGKVKLLDSETSFGMEDDIVKSGSGYTNKGKEGTHGQFSTKKAAAKQTAAMYANGYKGDALTPKFKQGDKVIYERKPYYVAEIRGERDGVVFYHLTQLPTLTGPGKFAVAEPNIKVADSEDKKMFKVVDKATGKTLLVKATDSLSAVKRVSSLKKS